MIRGTRYNKTSMTNYKVTTFKERTGLLSSNKIVFDLPEG